MSSESIVAVLIILILAVLFAVISRSKTTTSTQKPLTALVCGATGVGKSTLINTLVKAEVSQTGIGAPVTQNTVRIPAPAGDLVFYDSKGLEVQEASQTYLLLMSDLLRLRFGQKAYDQIDIVLMCIQEPQGRIDEAHREISALCEDLRIPYGIVLTKTEGNTSLEQEVYKLFPRAAFIRRVRSLELRLAHLVIPAEGLSELIEDVRCVVSRNPDRGIQRALRGRNTQRLAYIARQLASSSKSHLAWVNFAENAWICLGIKDPTWKGLVKGLRGDVKSILVPQFIKRTVNTSFDDPRIDGAIAKRILPIVMRRFAANEQSLSKMDLSQICREAATTLSEDRPYRSRFWN